MKEQRVFTKLAVYDDSNYPETIARMTMDEREHPESVTIERHQGKYRVHTSFWDGTKYQSQAVGARYGYKLLTLAEKAYRAEIASIVVRQEKIAAAKAATQRMLDALTTPKPRVSIPAIARQIA